MTRSSVVSVALSALFILAVIFFPALKNALNSISGTNNVGNPSAADCTSYSNVYNPDCASTVFQSQYDEDLATGNWPTPVSDSMPATYVAHNVTELASYQNTLQPGNILELADGEWSDSVAITFTTNGTAQNPIVIRAETPGGVIFSNDVSFEFVGQHLQIQGLSFVGEHEKGAGRGRALRIGSSAASCNYCLVDNVTFDSYSLPDTPVQGAHSIETHGQWIVVSNSTFKGKRDLGTEISMFENEHPSDVRDYLLIKNNYFADRPTRGKDESEVLRLGDSNGSFRESRSYVIGNLFEDYAPESELISIKKDNIVIRNNTFIRSGLMPVSARAGSDTTVEANVFDQDNTTNLGGVRLSDEGHIVAHNIFQDFDSGNSSIVQPISLFVGSTTGGGADYREVFDVDIIFNSFSSIVETVLRSGHRPSATQTAWPTDTTFAYNIIKASGSDPAFNRVDPPSMITFSGNIFDGANFGTLSTTGFTLQSVAMSNNSGVNYSNNSAYDFVTKPYRNLYQEVGVPIDTLKRLQYVNSAPGSTITLRKLTSDDVGAQYDVQTPSPDTTPPTISAVIATPSTANATITFSTNEAADSQIDYGTSAAYGQQTTLSSPLVMSHTRSISGLSPNTTYYFRIRARDGSGNTAMSTGTFSTTAVLDTTPPVITSRTVTPSITTAVIAWNTNEPANSQVDYGLSTTYSASTTLVTSLTTAHNHTISGLAPNTLYYYRVRSRDAALNSNTQTGTFTTNAAADTTPPTITNRTATPSTSTAAVTWNTNEAADSLVEYGPTTSYASSTTVSGTLATSHNRTLTGLSPNTTYYYRVRSRDGSLNSASSTGSFMTQNVVDLTAPIISNRVASPSTSTALITWTTNEVSDSFIDYGLSTNYNLTIALDTTLRTNHSRPLTGLSPNTTYYYRVRSRDAALNVANSAGTFTTTIAADTTAPIISLVVASPAISSATITFSTNEAADSLVEYGLSTTYSASTTLSTPFATTHSHTISGLAPNTTYFFRVRARDGSLNSRTSTGSFMTQVEEDDDEDDDEDEEVEPPPRRSGGGGGGGGGSRNSKSTNATSTTAKPTTNTTSPQTFSLPLPTATTPVSDIVVTLNSLISKPLPTRSEDLQKIVAYLNAVLIRLRTPTTSGITTPNTPVVSNSNFTRDLTVGSTGEDVLRLQRWLNQNGYLIARDGPGSPGNETIYFGPSTAFAIGRLQVTNGIKPASGFFGAETRVFVNQRVQR